MLSPISPTPDTMSAVTSITKTRTRATSLSLTLSLGLQSRGVRPSLETLPTEILLKIATIVFSTPRPSSWNFASHGYRLGGQSSSSDSSSEEDEDTDDKKDSWALDKATLCALALTSRTISAVAHAVLYRTVQLNELRPLELFARTTRIVRKPHDVYSPSFADFNSGKETTRLILNLPAYDTFLSSSSRLTLRDRRMLEQQNRLYAAAVSVLGFGPAVSPSSPSAIFNDLRTLVVPSEVLSQAMKSMPIRAPEEAGVNGLGSSAPTPSELVLDTYLPLPSPFFLSGEVAPIPAHQSLLSRLGSSLTRLTIATPPKLWSLPSDTLDALGGAPSLTHLALVRRANANGDNDAEFVNDIRQILEQRSDTLKCLVIAVLPDSTFRRWKTQQRQELNNDVSSENDERIAELDPHSTMDPTLEALESYLLETDIWKSLSALALDYPFSKHASRPCVCVIPTSGDAWARATDKGNGDSAYARNIYLDTPKSKAGAVNGDFWTWVRRYDQGRRAREAYKASMMQVD